MRPILYPVPAPAFASAGMTTLRAQTIQAFAVHFPQAVLAGGHLLPAGNYTVSTLEGVGAIPIVRFQHESGEAMAVMVTREFLPIEELLQTSEVLVTANLNNALRVVKIAMEGNPFLFVIADLT